MKPLRIAIVSGSQAAPTFIVSLANGLHQAGHTVALVGRDYGSKNKSGRYQRVITHHHRFNFLRLSAEAVMIVLFNLSMALKAYRLMKYSSLPAAAQVKKFIWFLKVFRFRPDVVHFQWVSHLIAYHEILACSMKTVVSLRGKQVNVSAFTDPVFRNEMEALLPRVHRIHAVSHDLARKALLLKARANRVEVIYSPSNMRLFDQFEQQRPQISGPVRLLSVGRFHWIKGYGFAIDGLAEWKKRKPEAQFTYTIVAQGQLPNELLYQIRELGMEDDVRIINGLGHDEVIRHMKESDALLLPSYIEGIANVAIEAMAVGLPVISVNSGGMSEVITSGETGILLNPCDSKAYVPALEEYYSWSSSKLNQVRQMAWGRARDMFSEPVQIGKFERFYQCSEKE